MYGLVLEGGGARGAYHIGAYKAILEEGIEIGGVSGTSVGALNGAMIVQGDLEKAYELWYNMSYSRVIDADDEEIEKLKKHKLSKDDIKIVMDKIKGVVNDKGFDITPLKELLDEVIDEEKIRSSEKDFGIVTISLTDLKPLEIYKEDIPEGLLCDYLIASAYLPVFKKGKIDGKKFLDGGIYDNLPIGLLQRKGYKDFIAVRTYGIGRLRKIKGQDIHVTYISPNEDLGKILEFDSQSSRKNLQLGYYDGLKALRGLKGYNYYIQPKGDEDYFINLFLSLGEEKILKIGKLLGIEGIPYRRALFEFIIPKISKLVGTDRENDYEDIALRLLEKLADSYNTERFNIYSYDEFLSNVMEKHKVDHDTETGFLPKIIEKVDFLAKFSKDEMIKQIADIVF
jgi:NTE family protein